MLLVLKNLAATRLYPHFYICFGFVLSTLSKIKERNKIFSTCAIQKKGFSYESQSKVVFLDASPLPIPIGTLCKRVLKVNFALACY